MKPLEGPRCFYDLQTESQDNPGSDVYSFVANGPYEQQRAESIESLFSKRMDEKKIP